MKSLARGQLLFVYGTLRRGSSHPLAQRLAETAEYAGEARAPGALYWAGDDYPGLLPTQDESYTKGDLYLLPDPALLDVLDTYEGATYERRRMPVESFTMGPAAAWVYVFLAQANPNQRIESGDYLQALAERGREQDTQASAAVATGPEVDHA